MQIENIKKNNLVSSWDISIQHWDEFNLIVILPYIYLRRQF